MEKGGIEDLFKKQVPRSLYRGYNATKHVITFYNGSSFAKLVPFIRATHPPQ